MPKFSLDGFTASATAKASGFENFRFLPEPEVELWRGRRVAAVGNLHQWSGKVDPPQYATPSSSSLSKVIKPSGTPLSIDDARTTPLTGDGTLFISLCSGDLQTAANRLQMGETCSGEHRQIISQLCNDLNKKLWYAEAASRLTPRSNINDFLREFHTAKDLRDERNWQTWSFDNLDTAGDDARVLGMDVTAAAAHLDQVISHLNHATTTQYGIRTPQSDQVLDAKCALEDMRSRLQLLTAPDKTAAFSFQVRQPLDTISSFTSRDGGYY